MIRLIYLDMLGYDASFGAIQAVTMAANINPVLKRVGYLAASILLGPEHELALMLTNTIQRDLKSENFVVVCAALDACCKLMSRDTVPALLPVIEPLSESGFEPVRKKTALALERVLQLTPDRAEDLFPRLRKALLDREPGVMTTALNAIYTAAKADPSPLRDLASPIQHILGQVVQGRLPKAYEYHKLPAPFLQIKVRHTHGMRGESSRGLIEGAADRNFRSRSA